MLLLPPHLQALASNDHVGDAQAYHDRPLHWAHTPKAPPVTCAQVNMSEGLVTAVLMLYHQGRLGTPTAYKANSLEMSSMQCAGRALLTCLARDSGRTIKQHDMLTPVLCIPVSPVHCTC